MKKLTISALTLAALALPLAASASSLFTFDPTGTAGPTGDIAGLATLDELPGSALSVNGAGAAANGSVQLLYQANLGNALYADGSSGFANGTGGKYFTFVAGFSEIITSNTAVGPGSVATFAIDTSKPSFFNMYATTAAGNDLSGKGFTTGTLILSGTISATNFSSSFYVPNSSILVPLDNHVNNDYPGVTSVVGSGSTSLTANITYANAAYFPSFSAGSFVTSFTNTSSVTPFSQVDPSATFSSNGIANGDVANNIGAVNGQSGPNFEFQADANTAFASAAVPEPGSLALVGLGLAAAGFVGRRRKVTQG